MRIPRRHCLILRYVYYILRLYSLFSHAWNDDVGVRSIRQHPKIKSYTPSHTTIVRAPCLTIQPAQTTPPQFALPNPRLILVIVLIGIRNRDS